MNRRIKQTIIVTICAIIGTLFVSWASLLKYIVQGALIEVRRQGNTIAWSGLSTTMTSLALDSIIAWIPGPPVKGAIRVPISLEAQEVEVALKMASLLTLSPTLSYRTKLYGGEISGDAQPFGTSPRFTARLDGVEAGQHPQLAALGLRGGRLKGTLSGVTVPAQGVPEGAFDITLEQLTPPDILLGSLPFSLSTVGDIDLSAFGRLTKSSLEVGGVILTTMYGSVEGSLTTLGVPPSMTALTGTLHITLSDKGASSFGFWLPAISGGVVESDDKSFNLHLHTTQCTPSAPQGTQFPLGKSCVEIAYSKN